MSKPREPVLSPVDREAIRIIENANAKYARYLEIMEQQSKIALTEDPPIQVERNWDHPLGLVIRKETYGLVESTAAGV